MIRPSDPDNLARELLGRELCDLEEEEQSVLERVAAGNYIGIDASEAAQLNMSFGDRLADRVAAIGGSWGFIIAFGVFLVLWMGWNELTKGHALAFDPYPFIFLNLMLSMIAAIQAPVIMMSQNRAAARDRDAADHDYVVNLRAELEIMHLHDKVDTMREKQMLEMLRQQREALRLLKGQVEKLTAVKKG